jgi:hypothetical protein
MPGPTSTLTAPPSLAPRGDEHCPAGHTRVRGTAPRSRQGPRPGSHGRATGPFPSDPRDRAGLGSRNADTGLARRSSYLGDARRCHCLAPWLPRTGPDRRGTRPVARGWRAPPTSASALLFQRAHAHVAAPAWEPGGGEAFRSPKDAARRLGRGRGGGEFLEPINNLEARSRQWEAGLAQPWC